MKHVFIVNPTAGPSDSTESIRETLNSCPEDWEVYTTTSEGDATRYVRQWLSCHDEEVRFYACGGDGTLNEVANGLAGHQNVSLACYPCGSGNDYVKYYGGKDSFLDIPALMEADAQPVDLMDVNGRLCINVCNFGFDTAVARTMTKVRRHKLMGGKLAYPTGIVKALFTAMKTDCRISLDGQSLGISKLLLCTIANGSHVGSAFKCAPRSKNDDGLLEFTLVKPLNHFRFFTMIKSYINGTHLDDPRFEGRFIYDRAKTVELRAPEGFALTVDGEILEGKHFMIKCLEKAVQFAVPKAAIGKEPV